MSDNNVENFSNETDETASASVNKKGVAAGVLALVVVGVAAGYRYLKSRRDQAPELASVTDIEDASA
jgi:hypothetical protein